MALAGAHFEFGYQKKVMANSSPVLGPLTSSETLATAGTTTASAPPTDLQGDPVVNIIVEADAWVSFGNPPPDPSVATSAHRFIFGVTPTPCLIPPGAQVRWVLA